MRKLLYLPLLCYLFTILSICDSARTPVVAKKTKLCGNVDCSEVLFSTKVTRTMGSSHDQFLAMNEGDVVTVRGIKFSDRTDVMDGTIGDRSGIFYVGSIDKGPFVEFLRNAIATKKEMISISRDEIDTGDKRIVGYVHSELDLVRDYNVQAKNYALEQKLPVPEEIPIPEAPTKGHGHSHDHGHGHSHGGHSHGGHGHTHEAPKVATPPVAATVVPESPTPAPIELATPPVPTTPSKSSPPEGTVVEQNDAAAVASQLGEVPVEAPVATPIVQVATNAETPALDKLAPEDLEREIEEAIRKESLSQAQNTVVNEKAVPEPVVPAVEVEEPLKKVELPTLSTGDLLGSTLPPLKAASQQVQAEVEPVAMDSEVKAAEHVVPVPVAAAELPSTPEVIPEAPLTSSESTGASPDLQPSPAISNEVINEQPTPAPEIALPPPTDIKLPPLYNTEIPTVVPTTPAPIPDDPKPTVAEQGFCDGDDCARLDNQYSADINPATPPPSTDSLVTPPQTENVLPPPSPIVADPAVEVTTAAPVDAAADPLLPETAFEDNLNVNRAAGSDFVDMEALTRNTRPTTGGSGVLSTVIGIVRSISPFEDMSDAGVGLLLNVMFVAAALLFHLISLVCCDSGDSLKWDHREAHDLATKCKELEEQLRQREDEVRRLGANAGRSQADSAEIINLRQQIEPLQMQVQQLTARLSQSESEMAVEKKEREDLEILRDRLREQAGNAEQRASHVQVEYDSVQKQLEESRKELSATKSSLDRHETDLGDERRRNEQLSAKMEDVKVTIDRLEKEIEAKKMELRKETEAHIQTERLYATASSMLEEYEKKMEVEREKGAEKENDAAESGGSGGWSDFGDEPFIGDDAVTVTKKEKSPPVGGASDLIKERALRTKIEQEYETAKSALEHAIEDKRRLEARLETLERDLERKTKEADERDAQRQEADKRSNNILEMMKSSNAKNEAKLNEADMECRKLREEVARWQSELSAVQEEKRKKEDRIKDLDSALKLMRNDFNKLESKSFHDVIELKKKLDAVQLQQVLAPSGAPGYDSLLNMSGSSIDRDAAPSRGAVQFEMPSIWDEGPSTVPTGRHSVGGSMKHRPLSDDDFPESAMPVVVKKPSRSRREKLVAREPSPSDVEKKQKEKKESVPAPRRRSRSHGRQIFMGHGVESMPPYMTGGYPPMHMHYQDPRSFGELDRGHSKSGQMYYSSGGSNGGRSPPPMMPSISALPPPGARRPSTKRATADYPQQPPEFH